MMPLLAKDMTSSTVDRLEWMNQVAAAAKTAASTYSSCRPDSRATKAGADLSGAAAASSRCNDSSIRPRPIATRPR